MNKVYIIGISGGSASGKTTLANFIKEEIGAGSSIVSLDNYYLDFNKPGIDISTINYDEPASLDIKLFIEHLINIKQSKPVEIPQYNYSTHSRKSDKILFVPGKYVIVDGLFLFNIGVPNKVFDYKIYVDTPDDIRFIRRLTRDVKERNRSIESVIKQYIETVRPMHYKFVQPNCRLADAIYSGESIDFIALNNLLENILQEK